MSTNKTEPLELLVPQNGGGNDNAIPGASPKTKAKPKEKVMQLLEGDPQQKSPSGPSDQVIGAEDLGADRGEATEQEAEQVVDGETVSFADLKKKWKVIDKAISADNFFANMPFILFLAGLAVIYIYNTHKMETTTRQIDKLKNEMKEYRWQYMSAKSNLMYNSKQTEVATAVEPTGLKELRVPPKKIVVKKGEY